MRGKYRVARASLSNKLPWGMQELATWVSGGKHSSRGNTMQRP